MTGEAGLDWRSSVWWNFLANIFLITWITVTDTSYLVIATSRSLMSCPPEKDWAAVTGVLVSDWDKDCLNPLSTDYPIIQWNSLSRPGERDSRERRKGCEDLPCIHIKIYHHVPQPVWARLSPPTHIVTHLGCRQTFSLAIISTELSLLRLGIDWATNNPFYWRYCWPHHHRQTYQFWWPYHHGPCYQKRISYSFLNMIIWVKIQGGAWPAGHLKQHHLTWTGDKIGPSHQLEETRQPTLWLSN